MYKIDMGTRKVQKCRNYTTIYCANLTRKRLLLCLFYRPQTKFAKVMFLHLSVSHSVHRGGCLPQCILGYTPLGADTPREQTCPPPAQCMLGDTGNKQAVRILLECILVFQYYCFCLQGMKEHLLRAHFNLPSVIAEDPDGKPPIYVRFEIPYYTVSGLQVN